MPNKPRLLGFLIYNSSYSDKDVRQIFSEIMSQTVNLNQASVPECSDRSDTMSFNGQELPIISRIPGLTSDFEICVKC